LTELTDRAIEQVMLRAQGRCECRLNGCPHVFDPREAYVGVIRKSRCVREYQEGEAGWEVEYRVPASVGGVDDCYNLHLLCESCHEFKTTLDRGLYRGCCRRPSR